MRRNERDTVVYRKILNEISDIESFIRDMGEDDFYKSKVTQKAIMMSLINIGELSKSFSDAYLNATSQNPWREIRGLRNIAAHQYEAIRLPNIWLTIQEDIPSLKQNLIDYPPEQ